MAIVKKAKPTRKQEDAATLDAQFPTGENEKREQLLWKTVTLGLLCDPATLSLKAGS